MNMKNNLFLVTVFFATICVTAGRADAVTEYCPADAAVLPLGAEYATIPQSRALAQSYYVYLSAESARSVSGHLALHTTTGWYAVAFPATPLAEVEEKWQASSRDFSRRSFRSAVFFVKFLTPVSVISAFVSDGQTTGETVLGWDAKGNQHCLGGADQETATSRPRSTRSFGMLNPPTAPKEIPEGAVVLSAIPMGAPGDVSCPKPFATASVSSFVAVSYPQDLGAMLHESGAALVEVAVSATGALDDAWIFVPSGSTQFDKAAVQAARNSTYRPARSFCQNAPGRYLFRAEFQPD
jgi:TonB family protein